MTLLEKINEFKSKIKTTNTVFIMGHKDIDLDALGAALGISDYLTSKRKKNYIILDDKRLELGVKKVLAKIKSNYSFIKSKDISKHITNKSALIIVDTNKQELLQNRESLNLFDNVIVIDHHDLNESSIKEGLIIIDNDASSTCEMIAELLERTKTKISPDIATVLLSGVMLDTNNYVLKTTSRTFKISYYLSLQGADPRKVQFILKQDLKRYIERQKVITDVKVVNFVAISVGRYKELYRREDLAKIADTLLLFNDIEASFVVGRIEKDVVGISARSFGKINVGKIMELFDGGGDENEAATRITGKTTRKVKEEIMEIIENL